MPHEIVIKEVHRFPDVNPGRLGHDNTVIFYTANGVMRTITIAKDSPSLAEIQSAITQELNFADKLKGQTFKVG